jgi:Protein of unknown function (DUF3443)
MNPRRIAAAKPARFLALVIGMTVLFGCGGGGAGGGGTPPTVTVTLSASSQTVLTGGTVQLTATVTGTSNTTLTWTVNGVTNGNSTVGTIVPSALTAVYTAPATVPNPATVTVKVTSQADNITSASTTVTINAPGVSISVGPTSATVQTGTTQQFNATVTGTTNQSVTWQVNGVTGGDTTNGMISAEGIYTAPASVPNPATVTVKAISAADITKTDSATVTVTTNISVNNVQFVQVNSGPANTLVNALFTNVTICVPGSATQCQTISNVQVDTGSEGLRLLSSAVPFNLPPVTDNSSNQLQECVQFADGSYIWGPVATADIQMAGETASSVPVQLIPAAGTLPVPTDCSSGGGPDLNTLISLGANGILGVGVFQQDCGSFCTSATLVSGYPYYLCPTGLCSIASVPLNFQLQNPVGMFTKDKNGFLITLPSIPDTGAESISGSMIFGIGTQANNALGTAQIYTVDINSGNFTTTYNGVTYGYGSGNQNSQSFIDSGSNGLYILDATTLNIPECTDAPGFYCPTSTTSFPPTGVVLQNAGVNGTQAPVTFKIGNADTLFGANNANNWAFDDLGGTFPSSFDWGLPFFYGRTVFTGIEGQTVGSAQGPLWAY